MSYRKLDALFPVAVELSEGLLAEKLAVLLSPDSRYPNGSSFAVTVDASQGMRHLWLSQASAERLGF